MTDSEMSTLMQAYRMIRGVASSIGAGDSSADTKGRQVAALQSAMVALLMAMDRTAEVDKKVSEPMIKLIGNVFGSQGGFVFVPFL